MDATLENVLALESRLLDPHTRRDPAQVASLLHPDFWEIGASGRTWSHAEVLAALANDPQPRATAGDMAARRISDNVVLVTYSAGDSRRSSLWVRGADGWRLLFHQGTSTRGRGLRFALRGPLSISLARPLRAVVVSLARRRPTWR
jgi:ribonuclease HI